MSLNSEFWTRLWSNLQTTLAGWLPTLAGVLILLLMGWLVARLSQAALSRLLRRLGLDRLAERAGATHVLTELGWQPSAARLVARVVYWLILLLFLLAAAESLGWRGVVEAFRSLVSYLPNVVAAALILLMGGFVARLVGDSVGALAKRSGMSAGPLVGQGVMYVLLLLVAILALEQLGVETRLLTTVIVVLLAATALALALSFGIGSRHLARNIMAGFHAKDVFQAGQQVSVHGHTGRLISIGRVKSLIETDNGHISLPNSLLTDEAVVIISDAGKEA